MPLLVVDNQSNLKRIVKRELPKYNYFNTQVWQLSLFLEENVSSFNLKFPHFVRKTHLTVKELLTKILCNSLFSPQNQCIHWVKIRINEIFRATFHVIYGNCQIQ